MIRDDSWWPSFNIKNKMYCVTATAQTMQLLPISKNDITSTPSSPEIFDPSLTDDPGLDATSPHNKHFTFHFPSFEDLISDSRFDPTRGRRSLTSCTPRRAGTPYLMFVLRTPLGRRCGADLALMCAEDGLSHVAVPC
ncbi:hypothetical protein MTP99_013340 [Tenebrio molitor]|nr:hypothetical protein MTP99_013340 [Tenebrio molitor]